MVATKAFIYTPKYNQISRTATKGIIPINFRREPPAKPLSMSIFDQFKEAVGSAFTNDETIKPLEGDEKPIVRQAGKVSASWLQEGTFKVDFYLTGVPTTDPSSDLWGSRVDVSTGSYDRTLKAIIPEEPNDTTVVKFNEGGKLFVEDCDFVEGEGLWKLEYEGGVNRLRFSLNTGGFEKMTKTGGEQRGASA